MCVTLYLPSLQSAVQSELVSIQPHFKQNLLEAVDVYKVDIEAFSESYTKVCVCGHCNSYLVLC